MFKKGGRSESRPFLNEFMIALFKIEHFFGIRKHRYLEGKYPVCEQDDDDDDDDDDEKQMYDNEDDAEIASLCAALPDFKLPAHFQRLAAPLVLNHISRVYHPVIAAAHELSTFSQVYTLTKNQQNDALSFLEVYYQKKYNQTFDTVRWIYDQFRMRNGVFSHHYFEPDTENQLLGWTMTAKYKKYHNFSIMALNILDTQIC